MTIFTKIKFFFKSIWNGVLGIAAEVILVAAFVLAGFLVCLVWWGCFK